MVDRQPPKRPSIEDLAREITKRHPPIPLPDPPLHPTLLTLRVDIVDAEPEIWRRIEIRGDLTLDAVHPYLQAALGWQDSHLHQFDAPGVKAGNKLHFLTEFDIREGADGVAETSARLDQVLPGPGDSLTYLYDYGDFWKHRLEVEAARPATDDDPPARCIGGRGACPPEDVGGIHVWNELAAALRADPDPLHLKANLQMYAEWLPRGLHPDDFSADDADLAMSLVGDGPDGQLDGLDDFDEAAPGADNCGWPEPRAELMSLLERCELQYRQTLGQIATRATAFGDPPSKEDLRITLRPWQAVLDAIGAEGVKLTPAGWMPPAVVQQIWHGSGVAWSGGKGNREEHTPEVAMLREECVWIGLVRKSKGLLALTKLGVRCRDSQTDLIAAVAHGMARDKREFDQDARVVALLAIATQPESGLEHPDAKTTLDLYSIFVDYLADILGQVGWRMGAGDLPRSSDLSGSAIRVLTLLNAGRGDRLVVPNSRGIRKLARMALFD